MAVAAHHYFRARRQRTWPCRVMMKTLGERVQTMTWSTFCGLRCTLFTDCSDAADVCGGLHHHPERVTPRMTWSTRKLGTDAPDLAGSGTHRQEQR